MNRNITVSRESDGRVRLTGHCVVTGKSYSVMVSEASAVAYYVKHENVAKAFPELSPAEREFLISGTSPEGWKRLFGKQQERKGRRTTP